MTFLKTALASAAALALAAPAFAGPDPVKVDHDAEAKMMQSDSVAERKARMKAEMDARVRAEMGIKANMKDGMHPSKVNDTVGEILQADGEPSMQSDDDIIVMDDTVDEAIFRAADDDGMIADNAIVVPGSNDTLSTVTCPAGTTAQPDMTCMITGDYTPDLTN
ncbi:hypothetical protein [uncultured Algimonas sp.]|uniref:hypothetical protein n=1 Tax=uncultured Algimonas sp. TaxID=1547920 RepID=UPI002608E8AD|nr:hypothetical protein [uncultured Algimonas sp.]